MKNLKKVLSFALALTMLLALSVTASAAEFSDVPADAGYAEAVDWCLENDLMQGVSAASFDPDGTLTRAMVVTVLYRAAGEPAVTGAPPLPMSRRESGTPAPSSGPPGRASSADTATAGLARTTP